MVEALISYIALLVAIGSHVVWSTKEDPAGPKVDLSAVMGMQPSRLPGASGATGAMRDAILVREGSKRRAW